MVEDTKGPIDPATRTFPIKVTSLVEMARNLEILSGEMKSLCTRLEQTNKRLSEYNGLREVVDSWEVKCRERSGPLRRAVEAQKVASEALEKQGKKSRDVGGYVIAIVSTCIAVLSLLVTLSALGR